MKRERERAGVMWPAILMGTQYSLSLLHELKLKFEEQIDPL